MTLRKRTESLERKKLLTNQNSADLHDIHEPSDLRGDYGNIAILFFLYVLQGIPLGIGQAIPMLLQNRGASYKEQAEFSFAYWPFSIKLLWAPLVDSIYFKAIGRRKSWMIPTQYLIGIFMLILSQHVSTWLGDGHANMPRVAVITLIFFSLNFLAATQDIAVDGWALSMLKRRNVSHASTCNSVGQTFGYFLGYVVFMAFESKEFCNKYIYSEHKDEGLVTLSGFLYFWGITFLVTTTLVGFLKKENKETKEQLEEHPDLGIKETYHMLWKIIRMKPVMLLATILLTVKVSFSACDAVTSLKLIDHGIPKEKLALLAVPLVPLQLLLPLVMSKHITGKYPMNFYIKAIPYRLMLTLVTSAIVWATPLIIRGRFDDIPIYFYVLLLVTYSFYQVFLYAMFCSAMSFFAKISDPKIGGTYMTLLNTLHNLGGNWPNTLVLWLIDLITWKSCVADGSERDFSAPKLNNNTCITHAEQEDCLSINGKCRIDIDGYYIEIILCLIYGIIWYKWGRSKINQLQRLPVKAWHVFHSKSKSS